MNKIKQTLFGVILAMVALGTLFGAAACGQPTDNTPTPEVPTPEVPAPETPEQPGGGETPEQPGSGETPEQPGKFGKGSVSPSFFPVS